MDAITQIVNKMAGCGNFSSVFYCQQLIVNNFSYAIYSQRLITSQTAIWIVFFSLC